MINRPLFIHRLSAVMFYLIVAVFLSGCATNIVVTPQAMENDIKSSFQVAGIVEYDGNKDYLPRTIKESSAQSDISIKYEYQITYGRDKTPQALPLFNPLTIVGFPIGEDTMVVTGNLTLSKGEEVIKAYTATCGMEKTRSIFSEGETFSELRKKGLLLIRDNIEIQMCGDKEFLLKLIHQTGGN
jgi:hypothetical protein